jgi:hypothetical protein
LVLRHEQKYPRLGELSQARAPALHKFMCDMNDCGEAPALYKT